MQDAMGTELERLFHVKQKGRDSGFFRDRGR